MSEPVVKQRPTIDLDDFERRIRGPEPVREHDPLAELARLVGEHHDPYGDVFAREPSAPHHDPYAEDGRYEPGFPDELRSAPRLFGDFAAIEAGLRGGFDPHHALPDPRGGTDAYGSAYGHEAAYGVEPSDQHWADPAQHYDPHQPARTSRRPMYLMATTIAVGVIGIGVAFALKGHVSSSAGEVKTIMADAGPTKIQPPPDATGDNGGQDGTQVGKAGQQTPTALVNRVEQPVDVAQAVQDNAARAAQANGGPLSVTDASSVPVPPSPRQIQAGLTDPQRGRGDAIGEQTQGFGLTDLPPAKRVKIVSVRPDGTILPNDQPPPAALPPRAQPATKGAGAPIAKASTPKAVPKTTSRVVNTTPKSIDALASGDDTQPAAVKPVKKAKPQRVALAEPEDQAANDDAAPATDAAAGGFAVQLAAPGSEAEARAAASRLSKKYADALGERHLGFHKADSNGKAVYRVRVSSLSRTDALSLCEKLKADGGSCFVAKN